MAIDGKKLAELAKAVQEHSHTRTCHKYDDSCRFHKPTFPMKETHIFQKEIESKIKANFSEAEAQNITQTQNHENPELLRKIKELLDDKEIINSIMEKFNKDEESLEEYKINRNARIDELLEIAGATYDEYLKALQASVKAGLMILLERDIDEGYINAFNPEWLEAWEGNIDLQPCFDYFAVITYITDYLTKDDSGITAILREVIKNSQSSDKKEQMQTLIHTFLTHRQMGQAEAYYKIIPNLKMKFSTVKTVFVPTDSKEYRSKFLTKVGQKTETYDKHVFSVSGRDGLFMEKPDLIDKYIRRPGPGNKYVEFQDKDPDTDKLVLSQYAKMMEVSKRKMLDEIEDTIDEDSFNFDEKDEKFHYIMTPVEHQKKIPLPEYMKLVPKYPGENNIMRKRRFPAAIRFNKKRIDKNPHKYFLSELMLYYPFRDEVKDLHADNEELCAELYIREKENIANVKAQVMEHLENVDEARYMVEEYLRTKEEEEEIGANLDPEKEQEIDDIDCEEEEYHPEFSHLDPTELLTAENNPIMREKMFKLIEIGDLDDLREQTRRLDKCQLFVVEKAIRYARGLVKSLKQKNKKPIPPLVMDHGGAGSGKSTVINVLAKWVQYILQRPGDDPDFP